METKMRTNANELPEGFFFDHVENPLFGEYERIEDDYLGENDGYRDAFAFTRYDESQGGCAIGANVSLAVACPVFDAVTGAYSGQWKVGFTSVELDEAPIGDIAWYIGSMGRTSLSDFADMCGYMKNGNDIYAFPTWEQTLGELLCRGKLAEPGFEWMGCPSEKSAVALMNMVMKADLPVGFFEENLVCDHGYDLGSERVDAAARDAAAPERAGEEKPGAGER